jgi:hypothetical protein
MLRTDFQLSNLLRCHTLLSSLDCRSSQVQGSCWYL